MPADAICSLSLPTLSEGEIEEAKPLHFRTHSTIIDEDETV
jgi:hypothetical protein